MRRITFCVAIIGLSILLALLLREPMEVSTLEEMMVGSIVKIQGLVTEERKFGSGKLLMVDDIEVFCECYNNYVGLEVYVEGVIERFPEDLRIRAFRIDLVEN